jgi:hypothetical protein
MTYNLFVDIARLSNENARLRKTLEFIVSIAQEEYGDGSHLPAGAEAALRHIKRRATNALEQSSGQLA